MKEDKILLREMEEKEGFFRHNNYQVVEATNESIIVKANITTNSLNPYGKVHGGLIFGLGDVVMGMIAKTTGRKAVTLDANINYLNPGDGEYLICKGELIKSGHKIAVVKANIYNDKEKLIAIMTGNYYYIDEGKNENYE